MFAICSMIWSDSTTNAEIAKAVLRCFADLGQEMLRSRLIGFASDSASVMKVL